MTRLAHTSYSRAGARARGLAVCAAAAVLGISGVVAGTANAATTQPADRRASSIWDGVFAHLRPLPELDSRHVVVTFTDPSLGEWESASDTPLTAATRRAFVVKARALQGKRLAALARTGVQFTVRHRYVRVVNGVSVVVHGNGAQLLHAAGGVRSVTQVRAVWPAAIDTGSSTSKHASKAARRAATTSTASPATTVAILDTGFDTAHPALADRIGSAGYDVLSDQKGVEPGIDDDHGTSVAGAVLRGAGATPVDLMPIRVLDSRPVFGGTEAVVGMSDDLIAGLERAVDPNGDDDVSDHVDVAVTAVVEPYASFTGSPEDLAVQGADALGTVVVAAAGNDGASGDGVGTIGAPAASTSAVAVGAADLRSSAPVATLHARGGIFDGAFSGVPVLTAAAVLPRGDLPVISIAATGDQPADYLDAELRSRVAGGVALIERREGVLIADQVRAAADAGAAAVLVGNAGGAEAAGTLDVDGADIPTLGLTRTAFTKLHDAATRGQTTVRISQASTDTNKSFGTVAGFSSQGARLDGAARPDVIAPGVGIVVPIGGVTTAGAARYATVSGTSIAAGWAAGQVASIRAAHPTWSASTVRAAVLGSARALGSPGDHAPVTAQGAGVLDDDAAIAATVAARMGRIDFGVVAPGATAQAPLALMGMDGSVRSGSADLLMDPERADGPALTRSENQLVVTTVAGARDGTYGGWIVVKGTNLRIPWSVTVRTPATVLPVSVTLSEQTVSPSAAAGAMPSVAQVALGGAAAQGGLGLTAAQQLQVRILNAAGRVVSSSGQIDQVLPGIYRVGISGADGRGKDLRPGMYQVQVRYVLATNSARGWQVGASAPLKIVKPGAGKPAADGPDRP